MSREPLLPMFWGWWGSHGELTREDTETCLLGLLAQEDRGRCPGLSLEWDRGLGDSGGGGGVLSLASQDSA
jgi:hypothetical protein